MFKLLVILASVVVCACQKEICAKWRPVVSGDTCQSLTTSNQLTEDALKSLNSGFRCDTLAAGDTLCLEKSQQTFTCAEYHTVIAGDICFGIAKTANISLRQLQEMNDGVNCNTLQIGQKLCIGNSIDATTTSSVTAKPSPTTTAAEKDSHCSSWHRVIENETCASISSGAKISQPTFQSLNPDTDCSLLLWGSEVCLGQSDQPLRCAQYHRVAAGDSCFDIASAANITLRQFMANNPSLECERLAPGTSVCAFATTNGQLAPGEGIWETQPDCAEYHQVTAGETCNSISQSYGVKPEMIAMLKQNLTCTTLKVNSQLCISNNSVCSNRYVTTTNDNCIAIMQKFQMTQALFSYLNPNVRCDPLTAGLAVCVRSKSDRLLPSLVCSENYTVASGDTCVGISAKFGITVDQMRFVNRVNLCESLRSGESICIGLQNSTSCAKFYSVAKNDTCDELRRISTLSQIELNRLNPTLDCSRLTLTDQICIGNHLPVISFDCSSGTGYFNAAKCSETYRLTVGDTCESIAATQASSVLHLQSLNPSLNCNDIQAGHLLCLNGYGNQTQEEVLNTLISALEPADASGLIKAMADYTRQPNRPNTNQFIADLLTAVRVDQSRKTLQQLYSRDASFKAAMDAQTPDRALACQQAKKSSFTEKTKSCVCDSTQLYLYCQALMNSEIRAFVETKLRSTVPSSVNAIGRERVKRAEFECDLQKFGKRDGCYKPNCKLPLGPVTFKVYGKICKATVSYIAGLIKLCKDTSDCIEAKGSEVGYKTLIDITTAFGAELCWCPGECVPVLKEIMEFIGLLPCLDISFKFTSVLNILNVDTSASVLGFKAKLSVMIKSGNLPIPDMCGLNEFNCEAYCLWNLYGSPPGSKYYDISINALAILGFEGIKLADWKIDAPKKAGCDPGSEAAILIKNFRTCQIEVNVYCWSGDDKMKPKIIGANGTFEFTFKPNIQGSTLFTCQFTPTFSGEMIGFDVYGGKSKLTGKENFQFSIRNDGFYYDGDKEYRPNDAGHSKNRQMGKWSKTCTDDESATSSDEPIGTSGLRVAACGKRMVGYYTGWGKREITSAQIELLTHVIFAFIAVDEKGGLSFGKVSPDSPQDAAKVFRDRFDKMRTLARQAQKGVKIMFAIGGWDNSQYFSKIASSQANRATLIDNIIKFITSEKIDGVDLDWEYPVTGGAQNGTKADKENFVALMKELKERLVSEASARKRKPYALSFAGAAGQWTLDPALDLPALMKYAEFVNMMTYDYYGAWGSQWGAYTGPPAPLFYGTPKGFSGKMNVDWTSKYYTCKLNTATQINMGLPFYGRYWTNVGAAINSSDDTWRTANAVNGVFDGGYVAWRDIGNSGWHLNNAKLHPIVKSPYIWDAGSKKFLGFENPDSLGFKKQYAIDKALGGLMFWALDLDDDQDTLLKVSTSADLCRFSGKKYECIPFDDQRWWTPENGGPSKQGMCGKSAPLINGYYPLCDPEDPGYACCGAMGYCGSGDEFCKCPTCADYRSNMSLLTRQPTKPSVPVTWYLMNAPDGKRGRCGKTAPAMDNGKPATCNPDDDSMYCCSNGGYCGIGKQFCDCDGCVNFRKHPK